MRKYTAAEFLANPQLQEQFDHAGEMVDGRFAVVNQRLYEVIDYKGCPDGFDYALLFVRDAQDVFGPEGLRFEPDLNLRLDEVYLACTNDEPHAIHNKMIELMQERLAAY